MNNQTIRQKTFYLIQDNLLSTKRYLWGLADEFIIKDEVWFYCDNLISNTLSDCVTDSVDAHIRSTVRLLINEMNE